VWRLVRSYPFTVYALVTGALWGWVLHLDPAAAQSLPARAAMFLAQFLSAPFAVAGYVLGLVVWAAADAAFGPGLTWPRVSGFAVVLALAQAADAALRWWRGPEPEAEVEASRFGLGLESDRR
jgi:hypothetical protein